MPEADGGQGFGLTELTVAVEELGRALVPGAFVPTVARERRPGLRRARPASSVRSSPMEQGTGPSRYRRPYHGHRRPGRRPDHYAARELVLGAPGADLVILPAGSVADTVWVAVDATSLDITPVDSLDLTRQLGRVTATDVVVPPERQLTGLASATVASLAAVVFGAEALGIADWAVHTAAEYAKIRHQFGRPIGQFQAVKHRCARMLVAAEQAAAAVWDAARALVTTVTRPSRRASPPRWRPSLATDAAVSCAHECIQVLGGIGYTWEHDAHLYYRRAMTLRALLAPRPGGAGWRSGRPALALAGGSAPSPARAAGRRTPSCARRSGPSSPRSPS